MARRARAVTAICYACVVVIKEVFMISDWCCYTYGSNFLLPRAYECCISRGIHVSDPKVQLTHSCASYCIVLSISTIIRKLSRNISTIVNEMHYWHIFGLI